MAVNLSVKRLKTFMKMSDFSFNVSSPSITSYASSSSDFDYLHLNWANDPNHSEIQRSEIRKDMEKYDYPETNVTINLESHFILSNPANYTVREYLQAWPSDQAYPIWINQPSNTKSNCESLLINLPETSELFEPITVNLRVNACDTRSPYIKDLDNVLAFKLRDFDHSTFDVYLMEFLDKLQRERIQVPSIERFEEYLETEDSLYDFYRRIYTTGFIRQYYSGNGVTNVIRTFSCDHPVDWLVRTSGLGALKHGYHMMLNLFNMEYEKTGISDAATEFWTLELIDLVLHFSISKIILTFLKVLQSFIPLTKLIEKAISLVKISIDKVAGAFAQSSTQPTLEEESVELSRTSGFSQAELISQLDQFPLDNKHIAASISAVVVLISSVIIGYDSCKYSTQKSTALKLSTSMQAISKVKNGISSMVSMFQDLQQWITLSMVSMMAGSIDDQITKLVLQSHVLESENCLKANFFEYLDFFKHPRNIHLIINNEVYLQQLEFIYKILDDITTNLAQQDNKNVGTNLRNYISKNLEEIKNVRKSVLKRPILESWRFTPFWINIIGDTGAGKSVAQVYIANAIYEILSKDSKYQIPHKDSWLYAVNFTDQYLTDYTGQYCMMIDDFLQDSAPVGNRSSCLDMISYVSSVPYKTNQAGLAEKGILFDSKIIISSSNDSNMARKEICSSDALKRRQAMCVSFKLDDTVAPDPILGFRKVKITLRNSKLYNEIVYTYKNMEEFIADIIVKYQQHWDHQFQIKNTRTMTQEIRTNIEDLIKQKQDLANLSHFNNTSSMNISYESQSSNETLSDPIDKSDIVEFPIELNKTSFIPYKCYFIKPNMKTVDMPLRSNPDLSIKIVIIDCDCQYHKNLNEEYKRYVDLIHVSSVPATIEEYEAPLTRSPYTMKFVSSYKSIMDKIKNLLANHKFQIILSFLTATSLFLTTRRLLKESKQRSFFDKTAVGYTTKPKQLIKKHAVIRSSDIFAESNGKQARDLAKKFMLKGLLCRVRNKNNQEISCGLRLKNRCVLMNHHILSNLEDGDEFELLISTSSGEQKSTQVFDSKQAIRIGNKDLAVYNCDKTLEQSKDITNHFPAECIKVENHQALVAAAHPFLQVHNNIFASPNIHTHATYEGDDQTIYNTLESYKTTCKVERGMSGSVLVSCENSTQHKILGIQVCKNEHDGCGYFVAVSKAEIDKAIDLVSNESFQVESLQKSSFKPDDNCPPNLGDSFEYLGTVHKNKRIKQQSKTKLIPSLIQEEPLTQLPSVLDDFDDRVDDQHYGKSVIFRAVEGFAKPIGSVNRAVLEQSLNDMKIEYDVVLDCKNIKRRLLTDDEMINGIPGLINRVEMKTSPGYPFVLERKNTQIGGKYEWFTELKTPTPGYDLTYVMNDSLKSGLEQREQSMLNGIKPNIIAYACKKDETRPLEKIKSGSTRAFICLPLDYNLLIRKYFGAFIAALHLRAGTVSSCVGIDPATQWKDLYNRLCEKNCEWEDFDYKNWDQHLHPEFLFSIASLVNYWYGDTDESPAGQVRHMLVYDLVYTNIIVKDRILRKRSGQCSGCAITAELNSLVHDLLMYYVWNLMNKKINRETDLHEFRTNVVYAIYGDDIIKAVRPDCPIEYSGNTIAPFMEQLGMKITPGDKKSTEFTLKKPSEVLFLKRAFREDGHYVKAPLRSDIVENILQWIHKSDKLSAADATYINCETAIRESYMHGDTYFQKVLSDVNRRIKVYNRYTQDHIKPVTLNYEQIDSKYRDCKYICAGLGFQPATDICLSDQDD